MYLDEKRMLAATGSVISIIRLCNYNLAIDQEEQEILPEDYFKEGNTLNRVRDSGSERTNSDEDEIVFELTKSRRNTNFQEDTSITPEF